MKYDSIPAAFFLVFLCQSFAIIIQELIGGAIEKVYIPYGVTEIGSKAFSYCESLNELRLPETVTELPERMCFDCYSLEEIRIPASVRSIGEDCFENCIKLSNVMISHGVERIKGGAFLGCKALRSVFVPNTVTSIDRFAFSGCSLLTDFRWEERVNAVELRTKGSFIGIIDMLNRNDLTEKYDIEFKAIPHRTCAEDAPTDFSSDCIEIPQAY